MNKIKKIFFAITSLFLVAGGATACKEKVNPQELVDDVYASLIYPNLTNGIKANFELYNEIDGVKISYVSADPTLLEISKNNDLAIVDTHQTEQSKEYESEGKYFSYTLIEQKYIVEFNYNFDLKYEILYYDDIVYDDGVLVYKDFPDGSFVDFDNDFDMIPYEDAYMENGVLTQVYTFIHNLSGIRADKSTCTSGINWGIKVHYK